MENMWLLFEIDERSLYMARCDMASWYLFCCSSHGWKLVFCTDSQSEEKKAVISHPLACLYKSVTKQNENNYIFLIFNSKLETLHNFASLRKIQLVIKYVPMNGGCTLSIN